MLLEVQQLQKIYGKGTSSTMALNNLNLGVNKGEFVAIMGESGSGKTTLLNIIATFDNPTLGRVVLNGRDLSTVKNKEISKFRREELGFVFQDFNLLNTFNNKDNILLPLVLADKKVDEMEASLADIAKILGIEDILRKMPYEISGGQKQRVAVARAIITNPSLLLADEPTGALDSKSSTNLMEIFKKINASGQTILMVTHSIQSACVANRVLFIKDGMIFHELYKGNSSDTEFSEKISDSLAVINRGGN